MRPKKKAVINPDTGLYSKKSGQGAYKRISKEEIRKLYPVFKRLFDYDQGK